ncbi:hypothetical protein VN97_g9846 [Penicillium thymicola]|uniref:F-box domain-containing protein n=1 Tax=Penicillium thymicola TaxID=293382 RepID=A0AAI9TAR2_PENTH|nr:hypothetical protein VN97_g9846 [Penicillium thymicola]
MDSDTQPILAGFMALRDNSSRRAALNEILDNLSHHEIREVKRRFETMTFQYDLLDKLPLELVVMLVKYLDLVDIVLLRRVSKRWHVLLSSPIVVTAAISYDMGNSVINSDFTPANLNALIKKRIRLERGLPAVMVKVPYDASPDIDVAPNRDAISCSNGVCAWIEELTGRTTIFVVNLPTGENRTLTTANREEFTHVQVSDNLISATSVRGYCHVWNMHNQQYKSFRIPSLRFGHYISIGSKVMLSYVDSVVHFCFDSGVTRSIQIGPLILLLSLHAEEDGFAVVCVRRKDGNNIQLHEYTCTRLFWEAHHLQTRKFSVHENTFICIWEQYQELPFRHDELWATQGDTIPTCRACLRPGQSSTVLGNNTTEDYRRTFYPTDDSPRRDEGKFGSLSLSLEADDRIIVHFHALQPHRRGPHVNLDYSEGGLIYCFENSHSSGTTRLRIGFEYSDPSLVRDAKAYRFESSHSVVFPYKWSCTSALGDGDFVIFLADGKIWIWCFDETWRPSGLPDMMIATGLFDRQKGSVEIVVDTW